MGTSQQSLVENVYWKCNFNRKRTFSFCVEIRQVENHIWDETSFEEPNKKPKEIMNKTLRLCIIRPYLVVRNVVLPLSQNWLSATILQRVNCTGSSAAAQCMEIAHTWHGIQMSGPTLFETNCDGNSAMRNERRNNVFPRLKSSVVNLRSVRKLSEFAWEMFPRSRSRAKNLYKVRTAEQLQIWDKGTTDIMPYECISTR